VTNPHTNTPAALFIADRVRDLKHRKSQKDIAREACFVNANMLSLLKSGASKVPLDRVPALARALEVVPSVFLQFDVLAHDCKGP
jgi:DNA-binding Xre family transcriptional regulator